MRRDRRGLRLGAVGGLELRWSSGDGIEGSKSVRDSSFQALTPKGTAAFTTCPEVATGAKRPEAFPGACRRAARNAMPQVVPTRPGARPGTRVGGAVTVRRAAARQ
ncbi:hypothetical protein TPA0910_25490 [Streptomyces hygroscopicus subsp. sporocinereus]|uniref:Uncharacterized protein n=1 Tax=Streptomyces hygroscopicus TaxID=1912 RepID=A0ABQ3TYP2_STRHY|nr:hypothetical protein TPA0910_25490 [Streptomyces hygroscopicus]GLV78000.1 hypothetical protein Shyhy02_60000 [Streptomyces hygroscopicus subsp. hygroscopicus]